MAPIRNRKVLFNSHPDGLPVPGENIKLAEDHIDLDNVPLNGGYLTKNLVVSLDPYLRGRMNRGGPGYIEGFEIGKPLVNFGVGKVLRSEASSIPVGSYVYDFYSFEEYSVRSPKLSAHGRIIKPVPGIPLSAWVGVVGMPGQTAVYGMKEIGELKAGQKIFISGAAGPVGATVGQIAKQHGLKVIGSAGSDAKVAFLQSLGFDVAFNYKTKSTKEELAKFGPLDLAWENVGGETFDAVLENMAPHGRILICGLISQYNAKPGEQYGLKNFHHVLGKRLTVKGFNVLDNHAKYGQAFYDEFPPQVAKGEIKNLEDVTHGIENTDVALVGMLQGKNHGKAVVVISEDN